MLTNSEAPFEICAESPLLARIQAAREIQAVTGNDRLRIYRADLASLDAVRGLAAEIERDNHRLDVLVNNAAIGGGRPVS